LEGVYDQTTPASRAATAQWDVSHVHSAQDQNGLVRVVVTRIEQDGTMLRRMVDTAHRDDGHLWAELSARALASVPPYQPVPGAAIYHVSVDGRTVQVGEYDLDGALGDLVTVVLAIGEALTE
jgi:hypothetical protein